MPLDPAYLNRPVRIINAAGDRALYAHPNANCQLRARTGQPHRLNPPTSPSIEEDDLTEDDVDHINRQIRNLLKTVSEEFAVEHLCKSLRLHKPELFQLLWKVRLGCVAESARRAAVRAQ